MMIMFSKHSGSEDKAGNGVVGYMCADKWTKDNVLEIRNPKPEILSGDLALMRRAISSVDFEKKYTSCVLSFHKNDIDVTKFNEGDKESREKVNDAIEAFENVAFAGIDIERRPPMLWTTHTHTGRLELNFVTTRAILVETKLRSINIAPPGDENRRTWDSLRDVLNMKNKWADPESPERKKVVDVPDYVLKKRALAERLGKETKKDPREIITEFVVQRIDAGVINNRNELIAQLVAQGFRVNRKGKDYVTVVDTTNEEKRYRLKGAFYSETFTSIAAIRSEYESRAPRNTAVLERKLAETEARLAEHLRKRASYNEFRYQESANRADSAGDTSCDEQDARRSDKAPEAPKSRGPVSGIEPKLDDQDRHAPGPGGGAPRSGGGSGSGLVRVDSATCYSSPLSSEDRDRSPAAEIAEPADHSSRQGRLVGSDRSNRYNNIRNKTGALGQNSINGRKQNGIRKSIQSVTQCTQKINNLLRLSELNNISNEICRRWHNRRQETINILLTNECNRIRTSFAQLRANMQQISERRDRKLKDEFLFPTAPLLAESRHVNGTEAVANIRENGNSSSGTRSLISVASERFSVACSKLNRTSDEFKRRIEQFKQTNRALDVGVRKMIDNNKEEIERFKTDIDLRNVALRLGFYTDKAMSDKNHTVMRHMNDKIIVGVSAKTSYWLWSSNSGAAGTVIDLVQSRLSLNLGETRKWLREMVGWKSPDTTKEFREKPKSIKENTTQKATLDWQECNENATPLFLTISRKIATTTLQAKEFKDTFREDERHNVVFPYHYDNELVAVERRNKSFEAGKPSFKQYTAAATPGAWKSNFPLAVKNLVFVESPIDAFSHFEMLENEKKDGVAYCAIRSGTPDEEIIRIIESVGNARIVAAFDTDKAGDTYTEKLKKLAKRDIFESRPVVKNSDWNEQLIQRKENIERTRKQKRDEQAGNDGSGKCGMCGM